MPALNQPSVEPVVAPLTLQPKSASSDHQTGRHDVKSWPHTDKPGRLTRRSEFLRVAASGKKAAVGGVVLQILPRADDGPVRLGFTVTRKVGNSVVRNRTRRRLKEAMRLLLRDCTVRGADVVLIGRDSTRKRDFRALQGDIRRALDRNGAI